MSGEELDVPERESRSAATERAAPSPEENRSETDDRSGTTGEPMLELDGVKKSFGTEQAVSGLSLSVREGELLTLLGPSGCGKTTTLRLIAGLERPDSGTVTLDGEAVSGDGGDAFRAPEERSVGVVFQEFALFSHLTAGENVAFGLDDWDEDAREERVNELFDLVGLDGQRDAYPDELSGGQRQRVALARSLAPEPDVLLLDEPFSNLDVDLRVRMREEVRRILDAAGVTAISVTHDQEEALSISDRVAVIWDGSVEQVGRPERVFQHPETRFVAGFLGRAHFLAGRVGPDTVETALGVVATSQVLDPPDDPGSGIELLVRPDDLAAEPVDATESEGGERGNAIVIARRYLGPRTHYEIDLDSGETVGCIRNHAVDIEVGQRVSVSLAADHDLSWFPARGDAPPADDP